MKKKIVNTRNLIKDDKQEIVTMKASEVRANFQEMIDKVHYTGQAVLISKHGKPWVYIEPLSEEDSQARRVINK